MSTILFKKKRIELGEGHIIQYTLFENKKIGGIWIYNWKTILQNRFHTHAFNSSAFLLSGGYTEEVIEDGKIKTKEVNQWLKRRKLPINYTHRILEAKPNTWTIVFFGKWIDHWWEYFDDTKTWVKYGWGRQKLKKVDGDETLNLENH
jgi:hypothetical protein